MHLHLLLQEEEERGEQWHAKWFEPAPDMQILPGEEPADVVPLWRWKGSYTAAVRDSMPAGDADWKGEATENMLSALQRVGSYRMPVPAFLGHQRLDCCAARASYFGAWRRCLFATADDHFVLTLMVVCVCCCCYRCCVWSRLLNKAAISSVS